MRVVIAACIVLSLSGCLTTERTWSGVDDYGNHYTVVERKPADAVKLISVSAIVAAAYSYVNK